MTDSLPSTAARPDRETLADPTAVVPRRLVAGLVDGLLFGLAYQVLLRSLGSGGLAMVVLLTLAVAYFGVVQGFTGATIGKLITEVRLVAPSGRPPGASAALIRTAALAVDGFLGIGIWMAWTSPGHRRLGDGFAGTFVVAEDTVGNPVPTAASAGGLLPTADSVLDPALATTGPLTWPAPVAATAVPSAGLHARQAGVGESSPDNAAAPLEQDAAVPGEDVPYWDDERGAYLQYDSVGQVWMEYDQEAGEWFALG